jgi:hypothetical protein
VHKNWPPKKVAERYIRLIEDDIPNEWLFNPGNIRYLHGACIPEIKAREIIRECIEKAGSGALRLSDKKELEQSFVDFAYGRKSQ